MSDDGQLASWLPQPGSDPYYAQLYLAPALKQALALLEGLRGEIARIPGTCSSPAIALPKLAWWREELAQLERGSPRHALTRGLLPFTTPSLLAGSHALVLGIESMLGAPPWPSREARHAAFDAAHGPLWGLALERCLGAPAPAVARTLGVLVEEAYALRDARRLLEGGLSLMLAPHIAATSAPASDPGGWHAAVFGPDLAGLEAELRDALATLPARRRLRPLVTLARLALATLGEIRADGDRVWSSRVALTPLRKLWIAWREARLGR